MADTGNAEQAARLAGLLESRFAALVAGLHPFYEEAEKAIYRVDRRDGPPWVLRLYPRGRPLERAYGEAAILQQVARHGVPAERLVPAADGAPVVTLDGRGVVVTEYIEGTAPDHSPATCRMAGDAVGRLHALPPLPGDADPLLRRRAGGLPAQDLPFGRACLDRVAGRVPPARRAQYDALRRALDATHDCEDLPTTLILSDCHLANGRRTADGRVVFFDWEGAGQGPPVFALGLLLYSCAVQAPGEPPGRPDLRRVDAVLEGYCRHLVPTPAELARLPDAVRCRPAVVAARELAASIERGRPEPPTGWWRRHAAADAVAARARRIVEGRR